jgi:WD40 repeat protein
MNLAQRAFESGNVGLGRGLLEFYRGANPSGQEDLRGFEWYYLWRLYNGQLAAFDDTEDIAFSRDGAVFATATADALKIWDAASLREKASFKLSGAPSSIDFSPDGRTLAYGHHQRVMLLDIGSGSSREVPTQGERQGRGETQDGERLPLRFSPDGKLLAVSYSCGRVAVYDTRSLRRITELGGGLAASGCESLVAFSPHGGVLAYGDHYNVRLWDTVAGRDLGEPEQDVSLPDSVDQVVSAAFSPDGKILAIGDRSKQVVLWNMSTRKVLARLKGHAGWVSALAFSPNGKTLYSGSMDQTVKLWDFSSYKEGGQVSDEKIRVFATIKGHTRWIRSINCSPSGRIIATSGADRTVKLWGEAGNRDFDTVEGVEAISPGANIIAKYAEQDSKSTDARMSLFDLRGGEPSTLGLVNGMNPILSPDAKTLATYSYDASDEGTSTTSRTNGGTRVKLWDVSSRPRELTTLRVQSSERPPTFSTDGRLFIALGPDGKSLILWDVADGKELTPVRNDAALKNYLLSPGGQVIVTVDEDGQRVKSWDAASRRQMAVFQRDAKHAAEADMEGEVWPMALAPGGKLLAFSDANEVKLWETSSTQGPILLGKHDEGVRALAFSPDGKLLATGDGGGVVKVWDATARRELSTFNGHKTAVTITTFSPDGKTLASGDNEGTVKLYGTVSMRELITLMHEPSPTSEIHALQGGEDTIRELFFSADCRSLISLSGNGVLRRWRGANDASVSARGR